MILLILLSLLLIIIPEFIYVKDIYPEHYRANTMFKLVFQAFMMLSLVSSYTIVRILSSFSVISNAKRVREVHTIPNQSEDLSLRRNGKILPVLGYTLFAVSTISSFLS